MAKARDVMTPLEQSQEALGILARLVGYNKDGTKCFLKEEGGTHSVSLLSSASRSETERHLRGALEWLCDGHKPQEILRKNEKIHGETWCNLELAIGQVNPDKITLILDADALRQKVMKCLQDNGQLHNEVYDIKFSHIPAAKGELPALKIETQILDVAKARELRAQYLGLELDAQGIARKVEAEILSVTMIRRETSAYHSIAFGLTPEIFTPVQQRLEELLSKPFIEERHAVVGDKLKELCELLGIKVASYEAKKLPDQFTQYNMRVSGIPDGAVADIPDFFRRVVDTKNIPTPDGKDALLMLSGSVIDEEEGKKREAQGYSALGAIAAAVASYMPYMHRAKAKPDPNAGTERERLLSFMPCRINPQRVHDFLRMPSDQLSLVLDEIITQVRGNPGRHKMGPGRNL